MAVPYALEIVAGSLGSQAPDDPDYNVVFNENLAKDTLIGTISNAQPGWRYTFNFGPGFDGDGGGRFYIVGNQIFAKAVVDAEGNPLFDFELGNLFSMSITGAELGGGTGVQAGQFGVYLNDINDAPTNLALKNATGGTVLSVVEKLAANTLIGNLTAYDQDLELGFGDALTYSITTNPGNRFKIDPTGTKVVLAAPLNYNASDLQSDSGGKFYEIKVRVTDAGGPGGALLHEEKTFKVYVIDDGLPNKAPTTPAGTGNVNEGTGNGQMVMTLDDVDDDGEAISYIFASALAGSNGLISADSKFKIVDNKIVTNGAVADVASDTPINYSLVANDGSGTANATSTGTVTITVRNVNKAPTTPSGTANVNEGTSNNQTVVTLAAKDGDNQTISYTFASFQAGSGGLISADGKFKIVNNTIVTNGTVADVTSDTPITYSIVANDGSGAANATATGNVTITVKNVNKAPTTPSGSANVTEGTGNGQTVMTLAAKDGDNQTISYAFANPQAGSGGLISADGKFKIVNNTIVTNGTVADVTSDTPITYSIIANDGSGTANATSTGNVTITVKNVVPVNQAPTTPSGTANVNEGAADNQTVLTLDDRDDDGQIIGYTFTNAQAGSNGLISADGRFKIVGNTIVTNGTVADVTSDTPINYSIVANDGSGAANATATGNVTITVKNVNKAPTTPSGTANVNEGAGNNLTVLTLAAKDADDQTISYTFANAQAGSNGLISADGRFKIVGNTIVTNGTVADVTSDTPINYSIVANDGSGAANATATGNVTITVKNVPANQAPATPSGTANVNEGAADNQTVLTLPDKDGDNQTVGYTFANAQAGSNGLISADGKFKIVGNTIVTNGTIADVTADTSLIYAIVANDGSGTANATATGNVTITVKNINKAPTIPAGAVDVDEGTAVDQTVLTLAERDADNQTIGYTFANALAGSNGLISADGKFKIVGHTIMTNGKVADVTADTPFTYSVVANDGSGTGNATSTGNVTITVKNVAPANQAPTVPSGSVTVNEGVSDNQTLLYLAARDGEDQVITYTFANALAGSNGLVSADGKFKIVGNTIVTSGPLGEENEDRTFTYSIVANDGSGAPNATSTGDVTITVKNIVPPVNDAPPPPPSGLATVNEGTSDNQILMVLAARDSDNEAITYTFADALAGSHGLVSADGKFRIVDNVVVTNVRVGEVDEHTAYTYAIIADDGSGAANATATGEITVTVTNILHHEPTDIVMSTSDVNENSAGGTLVGVLEAVDPDIGDVFTYEFVHRNGALQDGGGRFGIEHVGDEWIVVVKDGANIDFEAQRSFDVVVKATDQLGLSREKTITLYVRDVGIEVQTGGSGNDVMRAGSGNDQLNGGGGSDTLFGGRGNDRLTGGTEGDVFVFDTAPNTQTNSDTITDFDTNEDKIYLDAIAFPRLGPRSSFGEPKSLAQTAFISGSDVSAGTSTEHRIIYNTTTGALYYDVDGSGNGTVNHAAVQIAVLSTKPALTVAHLFII